MEVSRAGWLLLSTLCALWPTGGRALRLEELNIEISAVKQVRFVPLVNNRTRPCVYTLERVQVSVPQANGREQPINDGSLLYSPQKVILAPGEKGGFKLYYQGPEDDRERYYRVRFTETPLAALPLRSGHEETVTDFRIALSATVIVRPAHTRFDYQLTESSITNTGNSYFKYLAARGCSREYLLAKYLAPGERWPFQPEERNAKKLLVFRDQIIPLQSCD